MVQFNLESIRFNSVTKDIFFDPPFSGLIWIKYFKVNSPIKRDHSFINGEIFSWIIVFLKLQIHIIQKFTDFPNRVDGSIFLLIRTIDIKIRSDSLIFCVGHDVSHLLCDEPSVKILL